MYKLRQREVVKWVKKGSMTDRGLMLGLEVRDISGEIAREWIIRYNKPIYKFLFRVFKKEKLNYIALAEKILNDCIDDGYVKKDNCGKISITSAGMQFVEITHNISEILKHPFILWLLKLSIPSYTIFRIVKLYLSR